MDSHREFTFLSIYIGAKYLSVTSDTKTNQKYKLWMQLIEAANCVCVNDVYVSRILECMVGYKENMSCSISEITPISLQNHSCHRPVWKPNCCRSTIKHAGDINAAAVVLHTSEKW